MNRDCKPTTGLSQSHFKGSCSQALSSQTIVDVLFNKEMDPDRILFESSEPKLKMTIKELQEKAKLFSKWLLRHDVRKGDVVMITGVADLEYLPLFLGTVSVGCICHTVVSSYFTPTLCQQINPSIIFVGHHIGKEAYLFAEKLKCNEVSERPSNLKMINILEDNPESRDYLKDDNSVTDEHYNKRIQTVTTEDPAIIVRTTGSTGSSKAVLLSHRTLVNAGIFGVDRGNSQLEIVAVPNPVNDDIQPPVITLQTLVNWKLYKCVISPTWLDFGCEDIEKFAKYLQDERITSYRGFPYEIIKLVNSGFLESYDISKMTSMNMLAQVVSKEMREKVFNHFPKSMVIYGASECLAGSATSPVLSSSEQLMNSVGYPFPHTEIKIVGDEGETLPICTPGEICIKGFGVFVGYLNNESNCSPVDQNGWLHMGDVGKMDDTGHIFYIGRKGDVMTYKHGGDKIYPKQITDVALSHPNIAEAVVVGLQSDERGDDIFLFCVLKNETLDSRESVQDFMVQNAPHEYVIPDFVVIVQSFPRIGARNKVDITTLKKMATKMREEAQNQN